MKVALLVASLIMSTAAGCIAQDFQKCVQNPQLHFIAQANIKYLDPGPPPDQGSDFGDEKRMHDYELGDLYRLQNSRTPQEVKQANDDAGELDMFIFRTVLGDTFNPTDPAFAATARLSQDLCEEATIIASEFKTDYNRQRPFLADKALKPATDISFLKTSPSYPSGHSLTGYLEGLVLAEILPERRDEILGRALEFARERNLLGVHYLSDIVSGRRIAYSAFAVIAQSPKFKGELAAAQAEVRAKFPPPQPTP